MRTKTLRFFGYSILFVLASLIYSGCNAQISDKHPFAEKHRKMVENQIRARGVKDKAVLEAMRKVQRHKFVPEKHIAQAYEDHPLPIGEGQTISQPYIVALMTDLLDLAPEERVLEIGTGSGYQAAILSEICDSVYSIEINPVLGKNADSLLAAEGYDNVKVKIGDGYQGWEKYAPFDGIIVTCSPSHIPKALQLQLAEGGKMIIPVGERSIQKLVLVSKSNGKILKEDIIGVRFVPMTGNKGIPY